MLVSCLAYSSTLKIEAICSSQVLVDCHWITWSYMPEDRTCLDFVRWLYPRQFKIGRGFSVCLKALPGFNNLCIDPLFL
jgi:hypothetical protein